MQQIQEPTHNHRHEHGQAGAQRAPFWVRHYDIVVNLVTMGRTKRIHRQTLALTGLQPDEALLDIGCGTGMLLMEAEKLMGNDGTLVGLDVEPAMIAQARSRAAKQRSNASFTVASISDIPYSDDSFDVAISSLMYHHLTPEEKENWAIELLRVLKPGGRVLVVDLNPARRSIITRLPGHSQAERRDHVQTIVTAQMRQADFLDVQSGAHPSKQLSYALGRKPAA